MLHTDKEIKAEIKNRIWKASNINGSKIDVNFDSGTTTLKGSVKGHRQRHIAEDQVSKLEGVLDVKNELAVIPTEKITDEIIAQNIMDDLSQKYNLEPSFLLIEVVDGVVTLTGTTPDLAAKVYVNVATIQTAGVIKVIDNVNVVLR